MKLYGAMASPYVARVMMFARIKGIELPLEPVPGGGTRSDEYLAFNPIGKMPSLDVDGECIAESEVICEYLEETADGGTALPGDARARAASRLVSRCVDLYVAPAIGPFFRQMNPASRDQAVIEQAAADLEKGLGFCEHFMRGGPFAAGDRPGLGDCALGSYLVLVKKMVYTLFAEDTTDPTGGSGRLAEWWAALQDNEPCRRTTDEYGQAVDGFMKAMAARRG